MREFDAPPHAPGKDSNRAAVAALSTTETVVWRSSPDRRALPRSTVKLAVTGSASRRRDQVATRRRRPRRRRATHTRAINRYFDVLLSGASPCRRDALRSSASAATKPKVSSVTEKRPVLEPTPTDFPCACT